MTAMDNLYKKGTLNRELSGRAYLYRPIRTREDYVADLLENALAASHDRTAALLGFVERLSPDEIAKLRSALKRRELAILRNRTCNVGGSDESGEARSCVDLQDSDHAICGGRCRGVLPRRAGHLPCDAG
jgi:hypothetical protein